MSKPSSQKCSRALSPIRACHSPSRSTISISRVSSAANRPGSELLYAEHQQLARSCAAASPGLVATLAGDSVSTCSGGEELLFRSEATRLLVPWFSTKKWMSRNRIRMSVKINLKTMDTDPANGQQTLICICSWIHNELALHAPMVNAAGDRTAELVSPRSFRKKFDHGFLTFFELPTVVSLWRLKLETWMDRRISTLGNDRDFEAVISVNRGDFELDSLSRFDMNWRRGEFVLLCRHLDTLGTFVSYLRCFRVVFKRKRGRQDHRDTQIANQI